MTLRSSDLQLDSDLDSIRNSCDVLVLLVLHVLNLLIMVMVMVSVMVLVMIEVIRWSLYRLLSVSLGDNQCHD